MRLMMKLLLCLCLLPVTVFCQERITNVMVGTNGDQKRIVVAFVEPTDDSFKMQSMIVDLTPVKNKKDQPAGVFVDLTSTVRNLATGEKKQKILQLRWQKTGEVEFKCDGKWKKLTADAATNKIVEAVTALVQIAPLNTKEPAKLNLPADIEQKIISVLDSLTIETFSCLRNLS